MIKTLTKQLIIEEPYRQMFCDGDGCDKGLDWGNDPAWSVVFLYSIGVHHNVYDEQAKHFCPDCAKEKGLQ